jgi:hypothetical protein
MFYLLRPPRQLVYLVKEEERWATRAEGLTSDFLFVPADERKESGLLDGLEIKSH